MNAETGTAEARAEMPNPGGGLQPGQFVRARLAGAVRPAAITVPQRAVLEGPKGKFVYVVNAESKAEPRPVRGRRVGRRGWVIDSGLAPGDKVIVDGVMKIAPARRCVPAAARRAPPRPTRGEGAPREGSATRRNGGAPDPPAQRAHAS